MPTDSLHDALDSDVTSVAVQLRTDDHAAAVDALRRVTEAVRDVVGDGAALPRISAIAPLPDGPLLRIDDLPADPVTRRELADAVEDLCTDAGFSPGALAVPDIDGLDDLDRCPRAVVLRLFPPPRGAAGRLPHHWIDLAGEWVFGDQAADADVRLRVLGVELTVPAKEAAGILHACATARTWCDVVTGEVTSRIRTASISFGVAPHVAMAAGGPRCDDRGLLARFELLAEVARECSDAAYASLDFEETFAELGLGVTGSAWLGAGGASPNRVAGRLIDSHVPDAFPFQLLGAGHVEALDPALPGLARVSPDRWELVVGAPDDWLPDGADRDAVRTEAWNLLAPLLLQADELDAALERAGTPESLDEASRQAVATGMPELDTIVIEPASHPRRGTRLTVLELAAWLAGEPHTDAPTSVSPVLRNFARELAVGLDDRHRQRLRSHAGSLIATGNSDDAAEQARCWLLADRLLRVHAPAWLRAAGLTESAERLATLGSIDADTQLVRGVDILGNAIGTASRRLEITETIAADRVHVVDALAWDTWEDVAQRTGWAAAADTVTHGIPGDLTFATDQRVMECSRDPDQRSQLDASTRGLGDEVWSTALQEIGATAWRSAWNQAEALVHHDTTFSVRTTLRRSLQDLVADADEVTIEMLLDDVDAAARDAIARLILVGDDQSDYLAKGITAGAGVEGGEIWQRALDDTRRVLGASLFDDAIDAARIRLADWADRAPRLVARAVVASVTREACSVAGRGVAARAAAEAMARTGSEDRAAAAAREAVEPLVGPLAEDSLELLSALVSISG